MLILEQWPRQIAPAAVGTLASNFRVLRMDQPAGQPSQDSWTTPVKGGVSPRMGRVYGLSMEYTAARAMVTAALCSACCGARPGRQVPIQVPRYARLLLWVVDWAGAADGPWLCRELAAVGTGREGGERSRGGDGL